MRSIFGRSVASAPRENSARPCFRSPRASPVPMRFQPSFLASIGSCRSRPFRIFRVPLAEVRECVGGLLRRRWDDGHADRRLHRKAKVRTGL